MTALRKKQNLFALVATCLIWIFLTLIFSLLSVFPKKDVYKTVRINLEAPSVPAVEKKVETAPAPAKIEEASKVSPPAPKAEPKTQAAAKKQTETKAPVKTETKAQPQNKTPKPAKQTLQKSVDELMAEQRAAKPKPKKEFDWSSFDDEAVESVSSSSTSSSVKANTAANSEVSALEGTAGKSAVKSENNAVSASSAVARNGEASSSTLSALSDISSTVYSASSANGVTGSSSVKTAQTSGGRIAMYMNDGSSRTLLEPRQPVIALSDRAAATIDTTKNLTVRFTVLPNGHVDLNSIKVTPAAIITPLVQSEIAAQISAWRFNQDSRTAAATFPYKIEKR